MTKAGVLRKGEFTCIISDFGQVQYKSVMVDVITYPHIEVTPLAASRELGQSIGFRCVTPDDTRQTFDYRWYKNGVEIISDHGDEIIEELIPAGSRLAVRRVTSDANYTCYITNTAGTSNLTAHVFLLPGNKTNKICESEKYEGVKWKRMGAGNFDIERCPTDTGEVFVLRNVRDGYSRRMCECKNNQCQWSQPNFAKCQSGHLVIIYDRLEKLRLGYQHDNMSDIFDTLYKFIKLASSQMLAGDVDVSCYILHTFIKTIWQFPMYTPQSGLFSYQSLMEVLDLLLQQAINSNHYEQKDLYVAPKIIDISNMLSKLEVKLLQITDGESIKLSALGFTTGNLTVIPTNLLPDGTAHVTHKPISHHPVHSSFQSNIIHGFSKLQQLNLSVVESHGKNTSLDEGEDTLTAEDKKEVKSTVQFYFKNLFPLMKVEPYGESMSNPVSDIYSIYLLNNWESSEEHIEIFLQHTQQDQHFTIDNDTQCAKWINYRMSFYGYWDASGCETIRKNLTTTTCWCTVPGTFAVFIKPEESKDIEEVNMNYDTVLLVGCILSLCGLSATIIVYLFTWRKLVGNVHCIHVNLTLSLAIVNILCLMCLGKSSVESVCVAVKILLQFFYLATFAFMFVEAVHMFVSVHGGNRMTKTCIKYFLIGWGIPTVSTGCVVIASEKLGYDKMCTYWCWLSAEHWHYYSFLIPMIVLILAQVGLTLAGFVSVYHWTEEWRYSDRKQYLYQGIEMMIIQLLLTICCITGSKILQNTPVYSFVFIFSDITLSFVIFFFYCVLKKQKFPRSSFRSFMLPEKVNESRSVEQTIQDHHNAVNKRKYTAERKRQLRFLVGSSGHYSGSSNSASTTVSGSGSGSDGPIRYKANSDNVDSGFSEETGSEQNCLVELHHLQKGSVKVKKSGDTGSKDSYILADPASPSELTNLKEVSILPINGNESLLQTAQPKTVKHTRFVFATDGSNDPLLSQQSALIH
ncbi:hypothetical protein LOTGIDRAFT_166940 [Lottia gigantea]|uniref:G-protein coupled receptors family 2 profile 2 domain-containing protein n=1 Tax=Lottia gigantea TaxID=225164 RepID=V3ZVN4_LOTGI|nr:hypothetical protein LOTGIDRAFT_166940 [Lottia gigantea]ESO86665.1 hypothetical protein LOTGIDRAFT_166940 [Lottia gigantea]